MGGRHASRVSTAPRRHAIPKDITAGKVTVDEFDLTNPKVDLDKVRQHIAQKRAMELLGQVGPAEKALDPEMVGDVPEEVFGNPEHPRLPEFLSKVQ